jgi:hypothetical protein
MPLPAITSFLIGNDFDTSNTISSSNGIDYYYNNRNDVSTLTATIRPSNASSISFTSNGYPFNLMSSTTDYSVYTFAPPTLMSTAKYTITLSSNGVDKTYYLYVKGSEATSYEIQ